MKPPLPGIDLPGIFVLRTIPDSRKIKAWIDDHGATSALVVGAGFIGLGKIFTSPLIRPSRRCCGLYEAVLTRRPTRAFVNNECGINRTDSLWRRWLQR